MPTQTAAEIFRDYATDGVASSGAHAPIKADIRAYLAEVEAVVALVELALATDTAAALTRLELARRGALFNSVI